MWERRELYNFSLAACLFIYLLFTCMCNFKFVTKETRKVLKNIAPDSVAPNESTH